MNNASAVAVTAAIRSVSGNSVCADCSALSKLSMHCGIQKTARAFPLPHFLASLTASGDAS